MNAHKRKKLFRMELAKEQKLEVAPEPVVAVEEVPAAEVAAEPVVEVAPAEVEQSESTDSAEAAPAKRSRKKVVEPAAE